MASITATTDTQSTPNQVAHVSLRSRGTTGSIGVASMSDSGKSISLHPTLRSGMSVPVQAIALQDVTPMELSASGFHHGCLDS